MRDERQRLRAGRSRDGHDDCTRPAFAFAFASGGRPAIGRGRSSRPTCGRVIAAGLPADAALAALTTVPAGLLGARRPARPDRRRAARLISSSMTGDFQNPETQIRMVFADGVRFEFDPPRRSDKADRTRGSAAGVDKKPRRDAPGSAKTRRMPSAPRCVGPPTLGRREHRNRSRPHPVDRGRAATCSSAAPRSCTVTNGDDPDRRHPRPRAARSRPSART